MKIDMPKLEDLARAVIQLNQDNAWDWVAVVEDARLGKTHTEFAMTFNPAVALALIAQVKQLQAERDEADRSAGEAHRTAGATQRAMQELTDYKRRVSSWMEQTTVELGHSRNKPFDEALLAAAAPAEQPAAGAFAFQPFAWLYTKEGNVPGTLDVKTALTKQDYPGYTATALYTGPVNGEPAGWAYRVKLGKVPASWRVSITEPRYSGDPGDIEVMPLYKGESVTSEVPV